MSFVSAPACKCVSVSVCDSFLPACRGPCELPSSLRLLVPRSRAISRKCSRRFPATNIRFISLRLSCNPSLPHLPHHARPQSYDECEWLSCAGLECLASTLTKSAPPHHPQVIDNSGALIAECVNVLKYPTSKGLASVGASMHSPEP